MYIDFLTTLHKSTTRDYLARVNDKELADMITIIQIIKKDLNNLLTVNNFTK